MSKTALVTGSIESGTLVGYRPVGNPFVAMYVTEDEWVHPGKCFDKFLDDQWATGGYELASEFDTPHDCVWHEIVMLGGWTLEYNELSEEWFQEEHPEFDAHTTTCRECRKALL